MNPQLITWTLAGGSIVFAIGLISAIGSRHQRKSKKVSTQFDWELKPREAAVKKELSDAAMKEAASGREESFAQISGNTR